MSNGTIVRHTLTQSAPPHLFHAHACAVMNQTYSQTPLTEGIQARGGIIVDLTTAVIVCARSMDKSDEHTEECLCACAGHFLLFDL